MINAFLTGSAIHKARDQKHSQKWKNIPMGEHTPSPIKRSSSLKTSEECTVCPPRVAPVGLARPLNNKQGCTPLAPDPSPLSHTLTFSLSSRWLLWPSLSNLGQGCCLHGKSPTSPSNDSSLSSIVGGAHGHLPFTLQNLWLQHQRVCLMALDKS